MKCDDIRVGDTIKVTTMTAGVLHQYQGQVAVIRHGVLRTTEGGTLWDAGWAGTYSFDLLDRPKPKLPVEPGAVIYAKHIEGYLCSNTFLFLRYDRKWVFPASGEFVSPEAIKEWTLAKVVEAG